MRFVRSLTVSRSEIIEFLRLWELSGDPRAPFEDLIITPLPGLTVPSRVAAVRQHFGGRSRITFDSGGYAVQQGVLSYEDLYQRLLAYYRANDWADVYVLPDFVPTTGLSDEEVANRVNATIAVGRLFFAEMPTSLRSRALPVVQGYSRKQVRSCVEAYLELGATTLGFGSFGTTGASNDVNVVTAQSIDLLAYLADLGTRYGFAIHAFGVGSPGLLPALYELGVYSFDSSSWLRTAGYGNVLLPFGIRRSITAGRLRERAGHRPLTSSEFRVLQEETEHACFFCSSFQAMRSNRFYQILHNLIVIMDTVDSLNSGAFTRNKFFMQNAEANIHLQLARKARRALG